MNHLRDYQVDAYNAINSTLQNGCKSALVVMATGLGKTETFLQVARDWPGRVLILAHRRELISQPRERYAKRYGEWPEMEMADWHASAKLLHDKCHVTVGSVQTMCSAKRLKKWDAKAFDLIIVDEAHHVPAHSYQRILDYFKSGNPDLRILGVTATPNRHDEVALGKHFNEVVINLDANWGIANGWLIPSDQYFVPVDGIDWSGCKKTEHDLTDRQVDNIMCQEKVLHGISKPVVDVGKQTIVFTSRNSANAVTGKVRLCCEIINRYSSEHRDRPNDAFWITKDTPSYTRDALLAKFRDGSLKYFVNCQIATEGFDAPCIDVVAIGRPTKSLSFYRQMIGRGMRPLPGVVDGLTTPEERRDAIARSACPRLLVMDFVGNDAGHQFVSAIDALGGKYDDTVVAAAVERAKHERRSVKISELLEYSEKKLLVERQHQLSEQSRKRLVADVKYRMVKVDPFDLMASTCGREPGWHQGRLPSDKQRDALLKFGVEPEKVAEFSFWQAHQMMDRLIEARKTNKASYKQRKILVKYGEPVDVTFEEARTRIDAIKANGWQPLR